MERRQTRPPSAVAAKPNARSRMRLRSSFRPVEDFHVQTLKLSVPITRSPLGNVISRGLSLSPQWALRAPAAVHTLIRPASVATAISPASETAKAIGETIRNPKLLGGLYDHLSSPEFRSWAVKRSPEAV